MLLWVDGQFKPELSRSSAQIVDHTFTILLFVVFLASVDVLSAMFEHAVNEPGEFMRGSGNRFRGA